jgi:hypothetical protein
VDEAGQEWDDDCVRIRGASGAALSADPVLFAGVSLALVAAVAQATAQLVDYWAFDMRYPALNGNSSAYVFSWLDALLMATTIAAFLVLALGNIHRRTSYALALAFAFFLVDNIANIHQRSPDGKLFLLPLFGTVFALVWRVSADSDPVVRRVLRLGLGMLGLSLAVHLAGPTFLARAGWSEHSWEYQVKIAIKECTELAGWALICAGAVAGARKARRMEQAGGVGTSEIAERDDLRGRPSASPAPGS